MNEKNFTRLALYFTGIITVLIWALLAWDNAHGGVPSHHLLADESMPAISNWWGGLLVPVLTWFLLYRVGRRSFANRASYAEAPTRIQHKFYGFAGGLGFGVILSTCFTLGYTDICGYMMLALLTSAFFFPIYRAECLLGLVLGMTYTFGGVLPAGIGTILVLAALIAYLLIRPAVIYTLSKVVLMVSPGKR